VQVWNALTKMATNWMAELGVATEEEADNVPALTDSVGFLLDFIHSLVGKLAGIGGHIDETFLYLCCHSYIKVSLLNSSRARKFPHNV